MYSLNSKHKGLNELNLQNPPISTLFFLNISLAPCLAKCPAQTILFHIVPDNSNRLTSVSPYQNSCSVLVSKTLMLYCLCFSFCNQDPSTEDPSQHVCCQCSYSRPGLSSSQWFSSPHHIFLYEKMVFW